jgi:hypothetical protein
MKYGQEEYYDTHVEKFLKDYKESVILNSNFNDEEKEIIANKAQKDLSEPGNYLLFIFHSKDLYFGKELNFNFKIADSQGNVVKTDIFQMFAKRTTIITDRSGTTSKWIDYEYQWMLKPSIKSDKSKEEKYLVQIIYPNNQSKIYEYIPIY